MIVTFQGVTGMYTEMRKSFLIGSALLASAVCGSAVQGLRLSIESEADVVLRWPSSTGQRFIVAYRTDLQPGTEWAFLHTAYAAAPTGVETTFTHANVVVYPPPAQGGGVGGGPPNDSSHRRSKDAQILLRTDPQGGVPQADLHLRGAGSP